MKTEIDNYRGYEIRFDTDNETFECDIDDSRSVKKSYPAVKKFIDEFIAENNTFKPFRIEKSPDSYHANGGIINVIGIRKDGRFIMQIGDKKEQLSDYDLDKYIVYNLDNLPFWQELEIIKKERLALIEKEKAIKAKFKMVTVKSIKANYKV